jgi:hypothetical protein
MMGDGWVMGYLWRACMADEGRGSTVPVFYEQRCHSQGSVFPPVPEFFNPFHSEGAGTFYDFSLT